MIGSLILYLILLVLVIVGVGKVRNLKQFFKKIKLGKPTGKQLVISILFIGFLFAVTITIGLIFYQAGLGADLEVVPNVVRNFGFVQILIVIIIGSIVEEMFFRGYLQQKTNIWTASFIFAFFHIGYGSFAEIIGAFFLGALLGYEFRKTKNLITAIITHLGYNLIVVLLIFSLPTIPVGF